MKNSKVKVKISQEARRGGMAKKAASGMPAMLGHSLLTTAEGRIVPKSDQIASARAR